MWGPFWYIFLLMWNLFYHVGAFFVHFSPYGELFLPCGGLFSPCGGLWLRFHPYWGLFFYHVGRQSYHVGDFLLRFSFYWELVSPCGGIFATFFSIWGAFLYIWGAFLYIYVGPFCTYGGGHFGPPPRTNIPVCSLPSHTIQGRPQDVGGGAKNFFFRSGNLHVAKLGGFGGMLPRENFLKQCNLVHFREYFDQILSLFFFRNYHFLYKKINILDKLLL